MRQGRSRNSLEDLGISCKTYEELPAVLSKGDALVHCAGKVGSRGSWDEFARVNIEWATTIFDKATEHDVGCFVYVSSIAALGYRKRPEGEVLDESSSPDLVEGELYGRSKLLAEQMLISRARNTSTRLVILRPGLIYGRSPSNSIQTWLRRGIVIDPDQRVPLVHINNFVDAVALVGETHDAESIFFVVDKEQPTLRDLNSLKINLGIMKYHPWRIGKIGYWLLCLCQYVYRYLRGRSDSVQKGYAVAEYYFSTRHLLYSSDRLRNRVGWSQAVNLIDGLKDIRKAVPSARDE
jgi:nucleoside-diphosphate-sugar epimerase